jgi:uncharacterized protein YbjT (DUF2867 family)
MTIYRGDTFMLFVMGATGRMGGAVLRHADGPTRAASRSGRPVAGATETVRFDLEDADTHAAALVGCSTLFAMRPPPSLSRAPFDALFASARKAGVGHLVCASVYGAEGSRVLPHRHMEAAARESGIAYTFLRPADFMQNLGDVHGARIQDTDEIVVPAGRGRSAFLDVEDIGYACAAILRDPAPHLGQGYDLTGPDALSFEDVATIMSRVLDREIRYRSVSVPVFVASEIRRGRPWSIALVMSALYTVQRFNRAAPVKLDFNRLTGREPGDLATYIERERDAFARPSMQRDASPSKT